jgi:hypothetical protein
MKTTTTQEAILNNSKLSEEEKINKLIEDKITNGGDDLTDPAAIAAGLYGLYQPKAIQLIDNLSGKAVKRVLKMVINSQLTSSTLKSQTKNEDDLYQIVERLLESKYLLILQTYFEKAYTEFQKEENNGTVETFKTE